MYTKKAKVVNPLGIHGRAASVFTHTASQFSSHVFVERADDSMKKAADLGAGAICIEGNPDFYGKSGFVTASTKGIHYFAEPREAEVPYFLVRELKEGYLNGVTGTYRPPEGYFIDEEEAEQFDKSFPPKEKLKLPGQLV